ncbi:MAG: 5-formyltetrahydrofolate cyclo-ligase [Chromatiales bacterium 21-64-14]|nr:MAG: 5-formyltetrahydrofolate cyclo-ligase [Chromatiales bacterium 21-64-14]HQU16522.1 5-formyltetrahydrofolate cyclo-ligase [Gammaproteobacteria bacterium]
MNLQAIRKEMRARRRALTDAEHDTCAESMARRLAATNWFQRSRRVACYLAVDGELDPEPVIQRAWALGKTVYLPVLDPLCDRLWFASYDPGDRLAKNRFGIPEPVHLDGRRIPPWTLDLVLTPLVAFAAHGERLGMGGGFYDRTFAYLRGRRCWHKPRLVGLAYEFQKIPSLTRREWDIPLHGCATDQGLYRWRL